MGIKITKITDFIYRNINNVWIMLNYKWNLIIEEEEFIQFYEYIYNLGLKIWIWILFKNWKKQYIIEIYKWKSWLLNNWFVYKEAETSKAVDILQKNIQNIINFSIFKWKVEIIKDFKLFEWEITKQDKIIKKYKQEDKDIIFNIMKNNINKYIKWDYKTFIDNIDNFNITNIDLEVDKFDGEEIYWKNIIVKNKTFFHYNLLFEDNVFQDLKNNNIKKKYDEFNIIEFINDLEEIAKSTEFIYFKIYKNKIDGNNIVLDSKKWTYSINLEKYYFKESLELLTDSSYKLMFLSKDFEIIQKKIIELENKFNFKKEMKRDIVDNLVYLQDWNYYNNYKMYSNLKYNINWLSIMKYYRNDWPNNISFKKEFFSWNEILFSPHKLIHKNDKWTFENALHNIIVWDTWSWKTYFAYYLTKQIIEQENTQVIYLDPLLFESQYLVKEVWEWNWNYIVDKKWNVKEVWKWNWNYIKDINYFSFEIFKTPVNIIWFITDDETERDIKNEVLISIIFWKLKLDEESISFIKTKINKYFIDNIWKYFNYHNFKNFFNKEIKILKKDNIILYESIKTSLDLWTKIENILSLENDLIDIIWKEKFVLFNLRNLFDANNFTLINVMFDLVKYISKRNVKKYKYIFIDEIWNLLLKAKENWKEEQIINWIDWLLRIIRQFNWIINMISQFYNDFKENWLLAWVNMKIILDNINIEQLLSNQINNKILLNYWKIFKEIKNNRKWLITINMGNINEVMIMNTQ